MAFATYKPSGGSGPSIFVPTRAPTRPLFRVGDYATLRAACNAVPSTGGDVLLPERYTHSAVSDATTVLIREGTRLIGQGNEETRPIIYCGNYKAIEATDAPDLYLENISFELAAPSNFRTIMAATDSDRIEFVGCSFTENGGLSDGSWTNLAFSGTRCNDLKFTECDVIRSQLKLSSSASCDGAIVRRCNFADSLQFGVSFVIFGSDQTVENLLIEDCVFDSPFGNGCIYIGNDPNPIQTNGVCRNITIRRNICKGTFTNGQQTGFLNGSECASNSNWYIHDNVITPSNKATTSFGIYVNPKQATGTSWTGDCHVYNNVISNTALYAIRMESKGANNYVHHNVVNNCQGTMFFGRAGATLNVAYENNQIFNSTLGVRSDATQAAVNVFYKDSRFQNCTTSTSSVASGALVNRGGNVVI